MNLWKEEKGGESFENYTRKTNSTAPANVSYDKLTIFRIYFELSIDCNYPGLSRVIRISG